MARRILLADDSVTAQNMGRRILTDAGYEVVTVNNGSAALKKITENRPDLIVLDVYMPGYGGLEVCQRIKEAAETARIPVLLTVGKLEPFKPEEARRVRADAFIIKPFEATELLTALTKLEDKIVAEPQPQKPVRFSKALAAVEQSDSGERFGDKETGWKNRLTIPGPNAKPQQSETEAPEAVVTASSRDFERVETGKPVEPNREFERPIPAGLPADITPEEIAAITAAAASFGGKAQEMAATPEVVSSDSVASQAVASVAASPETAVQPSEPEAPAATLASAPEVEKEAPAEVAAEAKPVTGEVESKAVASEPVPEDPPATTELPAVTADTASETATTSETVVREAEKRASGDAEVMAAIASLAPANGHGGESIPPASQSANGTGQEVPASAVSVLVAAAAMTGPRWVAESVAVAVDESALMLEQEMEKASAANAAAEAARNQLPPASSVEIPTPTSVEVANPAAVVEPAEPTIAAVASVVETVAAAEAVPTPMAAETVSAESSMVESVAPVVAKKEEAAFAAAAAAGSVAEYPSPVEAVSPAAPPESSESKTVAQTDGAPQREAELAAAWQNWKQIREQFVGSQPASQVTEAPAAEVKAAQEEMAAPAKATSEEAAAETAEAEAAASDAPGESTAIASIVDTMLAELRPKLVEEIAKKMSSEKKDKEKKKKK